MLLDRTQPPAFEAIAAPHFSWPKTHTLKNGLPLHLLSMGKQPIIKLTLTFDAGKWQEPANGVAYFTTKMLLEGTKRLSAVEVANYIDQYGASLTTKVQPDTWSITLVTLSKHLVPMLTLLSDVLLQPAFVSQRLAHRKRLKQQALKLDAEKSSRIAQKAFREALFQSAHPYGRQLTAVAIAAVTIAQIKQYYKTQLFVGGRAFLSGQLSDQDLQNVQNCLEALPVLCPQSPSILSAATPLISSSPCQVQKPAKGRLQAAINMGKVLFTPEHPDYPSMLFVITLLGGYFGSRLMRNIREEKGYTYGIHAHIVPLRHASYLQIATEVRSDALEDTCKEICRELTTLQNVPVPQEELKTLRNYLLGSFLAHINDPFSIMSKFSMVTLHRLDQTYYTRLLHTINTIKAPRIMEIANQYLSPEQLSQVTVA